MRRKTHRASRKLSRNRRRNTFKKRKTNRKRGGRPYDSSPENSVRQLGYEEDCERNPRDPNCSEESDIRTPKERKKIFCRDYTITKERKEELDQEVQELQNKLAEYGKPKKQPSQMKGELTIKKRELREITDKLYSFSDRSSLKRGSIKSLEDCDEESEEESVKERLKFKNIPSRGKEYLKNMSLHGKSLQCHDSEGIVAWWKQNKTKYPRVTDIIEGRKGTTSYVVNIFPGKETTMRYSELSQIVTKLRKIPNFKGKIQQSFWKTSRFRSKYNNCIDRIKEINEFLKKIKQHQQDIEEYDYDTGEKWTEDLNRLLNGDDDVYHLSEVDIEGALIPTLQREDYMKELAKQVQNRRVSDSDRDSYACDIYNILLINSDKKKKQKQNPKIKIDEESSKSDLKKADREIILKFHPDKLDQMVRYEKLTKKDGESLKYIFHEVYTPAKDYLAEKRQ